MRLYIAGDTHGNINVVVNHITRAARLGISEMIVVGDCGLWPGHNGKLFINKVSDTAKIYGVDVFFLPGNHDDYNQWNDYLASDLPKVDGFTTILPRLHLSPKVHNWSWDNKQFFIAGGAVSIDKQFRVLNKSWWADEVLSDADMDKVMRHDGPVDYLLTHDCSDYTIFPFRLIADPDSQDHRRLIDQVIAHTKPKMHWHGHMHVGLEWENSASHGNLVSAFDTRPWNGPVTRTFALDCDGQINSWGVLNTETDEFAWNVDA